MTINIKGLLHDHIDGSMAVLDIIVDLYRLAGRTFPFTSKEAWRKYFQNPQEDIIAKFDSITSVMQTAEAIELVCYAYGRRRAMEGYAYVEGKLAPQYHVRGGLTLRQAADAMYRGLMRAQKTFRIRIVPVICIGREASPETGVEIAKIALEYDGDMVLDLVCDEAAHPPEKHLKAYKMTFGSRVRRDCHAGEWVKCAPLSTYRQRLLKNVRTAVYILRCHGIGHAIPLCDDPELVEYIANNGIRVSGCPLSNLCSGLIDAVRELKIDDLLDRNVIYTLNPDDDLIFPDMREVVIHCDLAYDFTEEQRRKLAANVFRGAFAREMLATTP